MYYLALVDKIDYCFKEEKCFLRSLGIPPQQYGPWR